VLNAALKIEPDYVAAMATLAKAYIVAPYFTRRVSAVELREQGRTWAEKALQLEPENTEALSSLAIVVNEQDIDSDKALQLLRRAIQDNPGNLAANNFLGDVLFRTGDMENAMIYESRATEIDPLAPVHLSDLSQVYVMTGDLEMALDLTNRALAQDPAFYTANQSKQEVFWRLGELQRFSDATTAFIESGGMGEYFKLTQLARIDLASGNIADAKSKILAAYEMVKRDEISPVRFAFEAVVHGEFDIAGEMLLKAYDAKLGNWTYPVYIRLPEQAPDSAPWQEFWSLPEPARLAEIRRANGMSPHYPKFGEHKERNP
jgi:tetratricopeptide (TPR) repeat protein